MTALPKSMHFSKYLKQKEDDSEPRHVTSVNITQAHRDFLKNKNLVLSEIVRDVIDKMMELDRQGEK